MPDLKKIGIMASGFGSNMEAIAQACETGEIPAEVAVVVSDKEQAFVLTRAKQHNIPRFFVNFKSFPDKTAYEQAVLRILQQHKVDLLVLAGYMRIVSPVLLRAFPMKVLNIHPALLPAFPGLKSIQKAYDYGVKVTGVTVHFVDEGVDTGAIILQEAVPICEGETIEALEEKIHAVEHALYKRAVSLVLSNKVKINGRKVTLTS